MAVSMHIAVAFFLEDIGFDSSFLYTNGKTELKYLLEI